MKGQRLKKHELVEFVFSRFWDEAKRANRSSIHDVALSLDTLREEIEKASGTPRNNTKWIYTQLKKYEHEHGVKLFTHGKDENGVETLRVSDTLVSFQQKKHLYRAEKLRLANAVVDYLAAEYETRDTAVRLWMGAGTTLALAAEVLATRGAETLPTIDVFTHNVEVLTTLLRPDAPPGVTVSIARGTIDPVTYTVIPPDGDALWPLDVDVVVQGTSALYDGNLYIESGDEAAVKRAILTETTGTKVLLLTLHEFFTQPPAGMHHYANIDEYDLVVTPIMKHPSVDQQHALDWFRGSTERFETQIKQWHYQILRSTVATAPADTSASADTTATAPADTAASPDTAAASPDTAAAPPDTAATHGAALHILR